MILQESTVTGTTRNRTSHTRCTSSSKRRRLGSKYSKTTASLIRYPLSHRIIKNARKQKTTKKQTKNKQKNQNNTPTSSRCEIQSKRRNSKNKCVQDENSQQDILNNFKNNAKDVTKSNNMQRYQRRQRKHNRKRVW